jgi:hypothetical protein
MTDVILLPLPLYIDVRTFVAMQGKVLLRLSVDDSLNLVMPASNVRGLYLREDTESVYGGNLEFCKRDIEERRLVITGERLSVFVTVERRLEHTG